MCLLILNIIIGVEIGRTTHKKKNETNLPNEYIYIFINSGKKFSLNAWNKLTYGSLTFILKVLSRDRKNNLIT